MGADGALPVIGVVPALADPEADKKAVLEFQDQAAEPEGFAVDPGKTAADNGMF